MNTTKGKAFVLLAGAAGLGAIQACGDSTDPQPMTQATLRSTSGATFTIPRSGINANSAKAAVPSPR